MTDLHCVRNKSGKVSANLSLKHGFPEQNIINNVIGISCIFAFAQINCLLFSLISYYLLEIAVQIGFTTIGC